MVILRIKIKLKLNGIINTITKNLLALKNKYDYQCATQKLFSSINFKNNINAILKKVLNTKTKLNTHTLYDKPNA